MNKLEISNELHASHQKNYVDPTLFNEAMNLLSSYHVATRLIVAPLSQDQLFTLMTKSKLEWIVDSVIMNHQLSEGVIVDAIDTFNRKQMKMVMQYQMLTESFKTDLQFTQAL